MQFKKLCGLVIIRFKQLQLYVSKVTLMSSGKKCYCYIKYLNVPIENSWSKYKIKILKIMQNYKITKTIIFSIQLFNHEIDN